MYRLFPVNYTHIQKIAKMVRGTVMGHVAMEGKSIDIDIDISARGSLQPKRFAWFVEQHKNSSVFEEHYV